VGATVWSTSAAPSACDPAASAAGLARRALTGAFLAVGAFAAAGLVVRVRFGRTAAASSVATSSAAGVAETGFADALRVLPRGVEPAGVASDARAALER